MKKLSSFPLIIFILSMILAACASIGSPDGGPYDETPPKVIKSTPENKAIGNDKKKITISFDEYIKIENASEKVVVSPPQTEMPEIRVSGKNVYITLFDSLKSNTTYTVDFSDAIVDNNEGNPMGQFTYTFSTGKDIDTMEVSGIILESENLEPIKGILVGLYENVDDSAFTSLPMDRVARTNGSGKFTIKGVAAGKKYRIFALEDMDGNFFFSQKSEKIGCGSILIEPSSVLAYRQDTIWRDSTHIDSVRTVPYTHFYPDNVIIRAFKEDFINRHLLKSERPDPYKFSIYFTGPSDSVPVIKGFNFDEKTALLPEISVNNDTLHYWVTDTTVAAKDTLIFSLTYMDTDTLNNLVERTDTLELAAKITRSQQLKELQKKTEEWEKEQEKEKKRRKDKFVPSENPHLKVELTCQLLPSGSIAPNENVKVSFPEPISRMDSTGAHFYKKVDTLWVEEPFLLLPDKYDIKSYILYGEWRPGEKYKFVLDSCSVESALRKCNNKVEKEINVQSLEQFSSLFININLPDSAVYVQLIDNSDKPVRTERVKDKRAEFYYVKPGDYYLRAFIDRNGDGKWTTGNYSKKQEPEEVFYFPQSLTLKAQWDVEQEWDVRSIQLDKQKPEAITKQKPDKEKTIKSRNAERNIR